MKLREEIIQQMYDVMVNNNLDYGLGDDLFNKVSAIVGVIDENDDRYDDMMSAFCDIEHAAFFAGANMILDFISGKEVAAV